MMGLRTLKTAAGDAAISVEGDLDESVLVSGNHNVISVVSGSHNVISVSRYGAALQPGAPSPLHQLPADIADFAGRRPQMEKLLGVLSVPGGHVAISAIDGMGGLGKTALAVHAAVRRLRGTDSTAGRAPRRDDEGAMLGRQQRRHLVAVMGIVEDQQHPLAA
jgi:hypothetical protein